MRNKIFIFLLLLISCYTSMAQWILSGRVVDEQTVPYQQAKIYLSTDTTRYVFTNDNGEFHINWLQPNSYILSIEIQSEIETFSVNSKAFHNTGSSITDIENFVVISNKPETTIDNDFLMEEVDIEGLTGNQNISEMLTSTKDPYEEVVAYKFSTAFFKRRGIASNYQNVCINGMRMNKLDANQASFYQWGALNDMFKNQTEATVYQPADFSASNIGGVINYNVKASSYRKGGKVGYTISNSTVTNRIVANYATGLMKNGLAVAAALAARFGREGYIEATPYYSYSYFLALEKRFGKHSLSLNGFGVWTSRGLSSACVQEVYDITNDPFYNPNWGYQGSKKRNSKIRKFHEPVILATHTWTINEKSYLETTFGVQFGFNRTSSLNWYNACNPRPDYYRYLPSYHQEASTANDVAIAWQNDVNTRQINWDRLYQVNHLSAENGEQARYILENRCIDYHQLSLSTNYKNELGEHTRLSIGLQIQRYHGNYYKTINDLLGGTYWLDIDQFAEQDYPDNENMYQNDLNNPNRKVVEGDRFGYDYNINSWYENLWTLANFSYNHIDFYIGGNINGSHFWRIGNMKNGRYADNSYGKSAVNNFINGGIHAGITGKFIYNQFINFNITAQTLAPSAKVAYISPRINDKIVNHLKSEKNLVFDLSYIIKYRRVKARITGYCGFYKDLTKMSSFFHDDYKTYVDQTLSDINTRHIGIELGADVKIINCLSAFVGATYADHRYTSRPIAYITSENGTIDDVEETIYIKNFYVPNGPQAAVSFGLKFSHETMWFAEFACSYYDKIYIDFNPERRTSLAIAGLSMENDYDLITTITKQNRVKGQFILDASVGKLFYLKKFRLNLNLKVNNILNNKKFITNGYEQLRFDFDEYDVNKHPAKYYYAYGTTFSLNVSLTF